MACHAIVVHFDEYQNVKQDAASRPWISCRAQTPIYHATEAGGGRRRHGRSARTAGKMRPEKAQRFRQQVFPALPGPLLRISAIRQK